MRRALSVKHISKKFGDFTAVDEVSFDVEDGEFFSILGPSGCGKTTLLRMIAGLCTPTGGTVEIRGKNMAGVEPNRRPVNLVFQHLALFPMMDVFENVAFGLRRRGEKGREVRKKVDSMLERVGLPGFDTKKITQLSGGQKQRVAIARCLVLDPTVLLLDEPLGALDAKLREHMKVELKKLQLEVGTTFVYITHDQSEALVMSDQVAVMHAGRFEQIDTPQNLYNNPSSAFVAQFVGDNNKFSVRVGKDSRGTYVGVTDQGKELILDGPGDLQEGGSYQLYVRPEAIVINPEPRGIPQNLLRATVKALLFDGGNSRILVVPEGSGRELLVSLPPQRQHEQFRPRDAVTIGWHPAAAVCFKASDERIYDEIR